MIQEDKDTLLKYLCMALPYGVICNVPTYNFAMTLTGKRLNYFCFHKNEWGIDYSHEIEAVLDPLNDQNNDYVVKPYLRPMSSMTEEEVNEYNQCWEKDRDDIMIIGKHFEEIYKSKKFTLYMHPVVPMYKHILWLLKHHFDFMDLIPKGLAIEVTEDNNPYKE